ncbi:MAG TPA: PEP-CTERM sorting domain-containing protein [Myxococcales bacterium]|nr:PEP-CTERM sorting domain-containing protein [Myxococcales bacterium]
MDPHPLTQVKRFVMGKFVLAAVSVLMVSGAQAAALDVSPDIAVELGGATIQQQDVARDDLSGGAPGSIADLGSLPDGADVVGYHEASPTQQLFVLDVTADLGGTYASAGDVIDYDPGTGVYQIELDMSALGIPDGTRVDAFGLASSGDYILSFDVTVDLGGGLVASDEDLVTYSLASGFTMLLNGANAGLDRGLDLDAASELNGNLLVSFDSDGSIGGIDFADEDVLSFDPAGSTWTRAYDGSAIHPGQWQGADLVAVPEPGVGSLLGAGMALLYGLGRRKRKRALLASFTIDQEWRIWR